MSTNPFSQVQQHVDVIKCEYKSILSTCKFTRNEDAEKFTICESNRKATWGIKHHINIIH